MRAIAAAVALAVVAAALPAGCGETGGRRSLVLYSGQHPQLTEALVQAFERRTGTDVRVRAGDGVVLADQLLQEGSASPADVYLTENSPELVTLDEHHLLAGLKRSTLAQVPARYRDRGGDWVGVALRVSALAYDPALVAPSRLPASLMQLTQPRWSGKVAVAPTDSDFVPLVGAVIATHGADAAARWLAGLKRNARLYQTDEAVAAAVNGGDVATGVINSYYWFRLRRELGGGAMRSALHYFPNRDVGSLWNISGAAVLAASAHPDNAQAFVRFLVGGVAQRIVARSDDFEYPARAGVAPNPALPALSSIAPATLSPAALGDDQRAARLIRESGLA